MSFLESENIITLKHQGMSYRVASCFIGKLNCFDFRGSADKLIPLGIESEYRSVFLCKENNIVIKNNTIKTLRRRIIKQFGLQKMYGRYSLFDEYKNLNILSHLDFVPKVYAFAKNTGFPIKNETLIIEYYDNALTANEILRIYPETRNEILEKIFHLFLKSWKAGFVHLDPKPDNILFLDKVELKFIDFESCFIGDGDKEFSLAFLMGYFFKHGADKKVSDNEYSKCVKSFLSDNCLDIKVRKFNLYFEYFKQHETSRRKRHKYFERVNLREKLLILE